MSTSECFCWPEREFLGPKRPGSLYIILLCILKESFSLETLCISQEYCFTQYCVWKNWIVITTKFYRKFCEIVTQKTETGHLGPGPSSCVIQTKWHIHEKMPYRQSVQYQSYIPPFSTKGPSYMVTMDRWQKYSESYRVKKARFGPLCKSCPSIIEKCIFIFCE